MAAEARISIHPDFTVGAIDRRLFGSFVEHMGRAVYTGIVEPGHPAADAAGVRRDVLDLVRELGTTVVRYPGGNFVSNYRWEDGVGPVDERPTRLDLAWRSLESNRFGTDEFIAWCRAAEVEPMLAVNLGTRGPADAAALVEYCNLAGGTALSDRRKANGAESAHDVRLWCLGNEMDGPWQIGHRTADEYGRLARQAAHAMRRVDPSIELVVCGSSGREMPTFGEWERVVLEHTYDDVEYLSVHAYYQERGGDRTSFLASGAAFEGFLRDVIATADAVGARRGSRTRMRLSVDEWNVWYIDDFAGEANLPIEQQPRLIEDDYSMLDAVVVADLLNALLRTADRVAIGCVAQLVNVIAPIRTEPGGPAWRQTTFHPLALLARHARGTALQSAITSPVLATARHGDVPALAAAVVANDEAGELVVSLVNRAAEPLAVSIDHAGFGAVAPVDAVTMIADAHGARRGPQQAATGVPVALPGVATGEGATTVTLPPESWSLVRLAAPALAPTTP